MEKGGLLRNDSEYPECPGCHLNPASAGLGALSHESPCLYR